jgi:branched-chain amino acid transport system permease protein
LKGPLTLVDGIQVGPIPGRALLRGAALLTVVVLLTLMPTLLSSYNLTIVTRILIMALFAMAFNLVFGLGGMPSLGHAGFFGIGGYVIALGTTRWGWEFPTLALVVVALSLAVGFLFGVLSYRAAGVYHLLLTLALAQAIWGLAFQQIHITRGDHGITGLTRDTIPLVPPDNISFFYLVLACTLVSIALLRLFVSSPVGRCIVGCREASSRMAALGFRVAGYRIGAYVVSAVFSAIAGALFAYHQRIVSPEYLEWTLSATIFVITILGGANSFYGPALGATILILLEHYVSMQTARWMTVLGATYMIVILFFPNGLLGLARLKLQESEDEPSAADHEDSPDEEDMEAVASSLGEEPS